MGRSTPKQQVIDYRPQLSELLKHSTRELPVLKQLYGVLLSWVGLWELQPAAVREGTVLFLH